MFSILEYRAVLAFRQHHEMPSSFGLSDIYVLCRMQPVTREIKPCPTEILECRWSCLDELLRCDELTPLIRRMVRLLHAGVQNGFDHIDIVSEQFESVLPGKTYRLFHRPLKLDS